MRFRVRAPSGFVTFATDPTNGWSDLTRGDPRPKAGLIGSRIRATAPDLVMKGCVVVVGATAGG